MGSRQTSIGIVEAFLALPEVATVIEKAHPQVRAVVNRFALYAAALRMAIEAGLLPWTIENADAGIVACMQRWAAQRGNVDEAGEIVRAACQIEADLVAGMNDGRFIHIRQDRQRMGAGHRSRRNQAADTRGVRWLLQA